MGADTPSIAVSAAGPYIVSGVPLTRCRPVMSEHDEPLTWQTTTTTLQTRPDYALCRCGQSSNKPFCDGTHRKVAFTGEESAPTDTYEARARSYRGTEIVVRDDRAVCEHAGFCGNRITNVWKMMGDSSTEDSVVRAQVMAMVERCPSGALTYRLEPDGGDIEPDLRPAIGVIDDGPLRVTGRVPIERSDGEPVEIRNRMTLCRCGQSSMKPLCDGTHRDVGFKDATT